MTWRLAIAFSLITCAGPATAAVVSGQVALQNASGRKVTDASGVVVWLEAAGATQPPIVPRSSVILQKEKAFIPHVVAIPVNSSIEFPNKDPIFHNAFSNFDGQIFDIGLYPPGKTRTVKFRRPGVVRVFCNIHPQMSALVVVLDTTLFDVSASTGSFRILNVPPGNYILKTYHERATPEVLKRLERKVTIGEEPSLVLPPLQISELGFIVPSHKNKYGSDYPAANDSGYPGGRR